MRHLSFLISPPRCSSSVLHHAPRSDSRGGGRILRGARARFQRDAYRVNCPPTAAAIDAYKVSDIVVRFHSLQVPFRRRGEGGRPPRRPRRQPAPPPSRAGRTREALGRAEDGYPRTRAGADGHVREPGPVRPHRRGTVPPALFLGVALMRLGLCAFLCVCVACARFARLFSLLALICRCTAMSWTLPKLTYPPRYARTHLPTTTHLPNRRSAPWCASAAKPAWRGWS